MTSILSHNFPTKMAPSPGVSPSLQTDDERAPLLSTGASAAREEACTEREGSVAQDDRVPARIVRRLYVSHFLSTWNSRVFEFGAVLYLATIFPGTLLPMSVYAFTRGLSAIVFAPVVGQYIDTSNRLQVVRVSIVVQRLVVAGSCVIFFLMARNVYMGPGGYQGMMALLAFFACLEKLCSIMNLVAVEKDWVSPRMQHHNPYPVDKED